MAKTKFNTDADDAIIKARISLYIEQPLYGVLALRLALRQTSAIKTLAVDHKNLYYNPDFLLSLEPDLRKAGVCHELLHIVYDHLDRLNGRNPKKWNAAGDYVINAALKKDSFQIGENWLFNAAYDGMTTDHIYTLLPDEDEKGDGPGDGGGWGEFDEMIPSDPADAAVNKAEWDIAVVQAAAIAKSAGNIPESFERFVEQIKAPKVDWKEKLRRFITQATKGDYSWMRPQRRMLPMGYYLPSLYSEAMAQLVVAIDTSGSIDQYTLDLFGSEIVAAKNAARPEQLVNIYCDAEVNHVDTFAEFDKVEFKMHGGGGTDFRPPFEHVETESLKPACFIYLTDGYGPFPDTPPPYPVLWVMTTDVRPPWGECVKIEA